MSAASAVLSKFTTSTSTSTSIKSFLEPKPIENIRFPAPILTSTKKIDTWKSLLQHDQRPWNGLPIPSHTSSFRFRGRAADKDIGDPEQDAFTQGKGSSDFHLNVMSDVVGATFDRLSSPLILGTFGTVLMWRHDAAALWAFFGFGLNILISLILKYTLNQARPPSSTSNSPGMPSSHAQTIFFSFAFAMSSILELLGMNGLTITLSGLILALGLYLAWLRVSQRKHTMEQVLVGAALGFSFFILWFWSFDATILEAVYLSTPFVILVIATVGFLYHVVINDD